MISYLSSSTNKIAKNTTKNITNYSIITLQEIKIKWKGSTKLGGMNLTQ